MLRRDVARLGGLCVTLALVFMLATGQVFADVAGNLVVSMMPTWTRSAVPTWTQSALVLGAVVVCATALAWALERGEHRTWWVLAALLLMQLVIAGYESRIVDLLPGRSPLRDWRTLAAAAPVAVGGVCVAEICLWRWNQHRRNLSPNHLRGYLSKRMTGKWVTSREIAMNHVLRLQLEVKFDADPEGVGGDSAALLQAVLARTAVLIVGVSGAGKTIKLTDLVARLDRPADDAPVPIMLDLAAYGADGPAPRSIEEWMAGDLGVRPRALARLLRQGPADGGAVVLLDALDQVRPELRRQCLGGIAAFRAEYPQVPVVVTSTEETADLLPGFTRAALQPPTPDDVRKALAHAGLAPDDPLHEFLDGNPEAMEFLRSPLMLSIAVPERAGTEEHREYHRIDLAAFVDRYLVRQLEERMPRMRYEPGEMRQWLRFIAHTRAEVFRPDEIDVADLPERTGFPWHGFLPAAALALAVVGTFAAVEGRSADWVDVLVWALIAGAVGFARGGTGGLQLRPRLQVDWRKVFNVVELGLDIMSGMFILGLLSGVGLAFGLVDAVYQYLHSLATHHSYSIPGWSAGDSPSRYLGRLGLLILAYAASLLMLSALGAVGWRIFKSAAGADQAEFAGGQRVLRSAANGLTAAVATWSAFLVPWAVISAIGTGSADGLLRVGLVPAMAAGLYLGGFSALSRLGVRICLYQQGYLPPHSGRFLRQLAGRGIFIPEGGGYKFRHNIIRAHVGQVIPGGSPTS